ncbi:zinc finger Y-chromosomal protein-like [Amphiura filiformis]|uniref:zinc finger Y-chromosomal protein-like n=1 Tax=Amphiura filiformis TaxID=82378 RepID=UPI003B2272B3
MGPRLRAEEDMKVLMPFSCTFCKLNLSDHCRWKRHINRHKKKYKYSKTSRKQKSWYQKLFNGYVSRDRNRSALLTSQCLSADIDHDYCKIKSIRIVTKASVTNDRPYQCDLCSNKYANEKQLKSHVRRHSYESKFSCKYCAKRLPGPKRLENHIVKVHGEDTPYKCEYCAESFATKCYLQVHSKIHATSFKCQFCSQNFLNEKSLYNHKRRHTYHTRFPCQQCGKCFAGPITLDRHMRVHNGTPFQCRYCPQVFATNEYLIIHERIHTKEKPQYQCEYCEQSFDWKSRYNRHMKVHTEKPHKCSMCLRRFVTIEDRTKHEGTHRKRNYACQFCGKLFLQNGQLNLHLKNAHCWQTVSVRVL